MLLSLDRNFGAASVQVPTAALAGMAQEMSPATPLLQPALPLT